MRSGIDISMVGDKDLEKKFRRLEDKVQKRIVRKALRAAAKRIKGRVVAKVSGDPVGVQTGRYRQAIQSTKVVAAKRSPGMISLGLPMPFREALGISPKDRHYFPAALEYGSDNASARPHFRPAVDENRAEEFRQIGRDIGTGIEREAKRK